MSDDEERPSDLGLDALAADMPSAGALARARRALDWARAGDLRWAMPVALLIALVAVSQMSTPVRPSGWFVTAFVVVAGLCALMASTVFGRTALTVALVLALVLVSADTQEHQTWQAGGDCSAVIGLVSLLPLCVFWAVSRRECLRYPPRFAAAVAGASGLCAAGLLHVYCGARAWQHLFGFHLGAVLVMVAIAGIWAIRPLGSRQG